MPRYTRRQLVATGASAATIGAFAGCVSNESSNGGSNDAGDGSGPRAQASFFVFGDFAAAVAGDTARAETLVPIGQHGHGWEPGPQIQGTVLESDLFVSVVHGFQPWADDLVTSLRDDDAAVHIVAAGAEVDLLESEGGHDYGHDDGDGHDHGNDEEHDHEEGGEHNRSEDGDDHDHEHNGSDDGDHEHDRGTADPHFWLDPVRAKRAVDAIEDGFATVDSDNADAYAANADEFRSRLDDLDETFRSTLEDAERDVVLVAGHDPFAYLENRYGFEIETLTGLTPDEQPTPADIERAQTVIDEYDLEYVCADPLEPQDAAEQLIAETDANEVLPLTPIAGQTQEWADEGWGYVEIMEEINLATLERALDA
ncbi:metal ABC transporter substrate-binding protein [Halopiger xanaduensis]|uniref:ABC-type metal ion transporter, periplasmic subunit n=1 Tax=Halopiger xanaduensis (strain DSM 18323 / JCM 14033 / SH-6) TaxID=797210 RepID=F8D795_HALXS|nr:zinc ABC transporter substrate-binding protein [Halopiger xanaduensis]AEH36663.1 ABC-type metal ion transporter, periplasmic subunit [Halopiger xanaduensis SH-6]